MPKVSILVPVYNVERYLEKCLGSIAAQTLCDLEVIVIDDGSTDGSGKIADEFARRDPRFRVIHKENTGYGDSMNVGISAARGDYIGIVESDDFAERAMFACLLAAAEQHDADVVKSNFYLHDSVPMERDVLFELAPPAFYNRVFCPANETGQGAVAFWNAKPSVWSALYKRAFLDENKILFLPTPGASFQDAGFSFKVWACAARVYLLPQAFIHYRQDNEASSVNSKEKVFCIFEEYDGIVRFLADMGKTALLPMMHRVKFDACMWNDARIAEEKREAFLARMAQDFISARAEGQLARALFEPWKWEELCAIMENPAAFHVRRAAGSPVQGAVPRMRRKARTFVYTLKTQGVRALYWLLKDALRRKRQSGGN